MSDTADRAIAHREYGALLVLGALFLVFLVPAIAEMRKEVRDGIRREHLTELKHALEMVNNTLGHYPRSPAGLRLPGEQAGVGCTISSDKKSWLFGLDGVLLNNRHRDTIPRDPFADRGWTYAYCVDAVTPTAATSWYLRTRLERPHPPQAGFDEEHNYYFRVLHDGESTLYDICGGVLTCGAQRRTPRP